MTILLATTSSADPIILKAGDKAPYEGFLFSREKEQVIRYKLIDLESLSKINESLNNQIEIQSKIYKLQQDKVDLYIDQNTKLAEQLRSERGMTNLERLGWFALGVVGTSLVLYGLSNLK